MTKPRVKKIHTTDDAATSHAIQYDNGKRSASEYVGGHVHFRNMNDGTLMVDLNATDSGVVVAVGARTADDPYLVVLSDVTNVLRELRRGNSDATHADYLAALAGITAERYRGLPGA